MILCIKTHNLISMEAPHFCMTHYHLQGDFLSMNSLHHHSNSLRYSTPPISQMKKWRHRAVKLTNHSQGRTRTPALLTLSPVLF